MGKLCSVFKGRVLCTLTKKNNSWISEVLNRCYRGDGVEEKQTDNNSGKTFFFFLWDQWWTLPRGVRDHRKRKASVERMDWMEDPNMRPFFLSPCAFIPLRTLSSCPSRKTTRTSRRHRLYSLCILLYNVAKNSTAPPLSPPLSSRSRVSHWTPWFLTRRVWYSELFCLWARLYFLSSLLLYVWFSAKTA